MFTRIKSYTEKRKQYFAQAKYEIMESNLKVVFNCSILTVVLLLFFMLFAFAILKDWRPTVAHMVFLLASVLFFAAVFLYKKSGLCRVRDVNTLCIMYGVILFFFVIWIDVTGNISAPSCFTPLVSIAVSSLFIFPSILTDVMLLILYAVYIALVILLKGPFIAQYDMFIAVVALGVSLVSSNIITALRMENHEIRVKYKLLSTHDAMLSGIYNKQGFQKSFEEYIRQHNPHVKGSVYFLDLDNFKMYNDEYGHYFGDLVLKRTSDVLLDIFRHDDLIGHWGGDEFIIFAEDLCDENAIAEKCMNIETALLSASKSVSNIGVNCSIGVLLIEDTEIEFETVFSEADRALYAAKDAGKGQYTLLRYSPDQQKRQITALW